MPTSTTTVPHHELLESSIGQLGDDLFLDYRFAIINGKARPGQTIDTEHFAAHHSIETAYAKKILEALAVHRYVTRTSNGYIVTNWSDDDIMDLIAATKEMQTALGLKFAERTDPRAIARMRETIAFEFGNPITAPQLEAFHIRWWTFFHQMLGTYKVATFRTINLTTTPAYLRRRMLNGLTFTELGDLHRRMKRLLEAIEANDATSIAEIYSEQIDIKLAGALADNPRYTASALDSEIDYTLAGDPLPYPQDRPSISRGFREPLTWKDYLGFQFRKIG